MKLTILVLMCLSALTLACMTALAPATLAPPSTPVPSATPRPTAYVESVGDAFATRLYTFVAVTDTNLRVCGGLDCAIVGGDAILRGDAVVASRPVGGEWALIIGRGWFCVPALEGRGGCEK